MVSVAGIDELYDDAHPVAGLAHAAFKNRFHPQLRADVADVDRLAFELKRRRARGDVDARQRAERVDELFGHPLAEVILILLLAHVREREHRNRRHHFRDAPAAPRRRR